MQIEHGQELLQMRLHYTDQFLQSLRLHRGVVEQDPTHQIKDIQQILGARRFRDMRQKLVEEFTSEKHETTLDCLIRQIGTLILANGYIDLVEHIRDTLALLLLASHSSRSSLF